MERTKCGLIMFLFVGFLGLSIKSAAQTPFKADLYKAYIKGDMFLWQSILGNKNLSDNSTYENKVDCLDGYYGLTAWLLGNGKKKEASVALTKGSEIIEQILKQKPDDATTLAYKAAFYGFAIGIQKFKAVILGPKSMQLVNEALEKDPENIQAHIEKGNILFYSPMLVGGDKTKSVEFYQKACLLMERKQLVQENWTYLSTSVQLAQVLEKNGEKGKAL